MATEGDDKDGSEKWDTNGLHIFLDSNSLSHCEASEREIIKRILSFNDRPFIMQRTPFRSAFKELNALETVTDQKEQRTESTLKTLGNSIFHRSISDGQKELLFTILIRSSIRRPYVKTFIKNAIFVTQDQLFLKNTYSIKREKLSLTSCFPYLRLVNLKRALEIMDIYAKMNGLYFGIPSKKDITPWYQLRLYCELMYAPVVYGNQYFGTSKTPSAEINALIFRFLKLILCKDYLGRQHYFGLSRGDNQDPYTEVSFISLDDMLLIFYHIEYLISLVTGIFDNLAIETATTYNIQQNPNRISLSNNSGRDFLRDVAKANPNLKRYIDDNRDFINLIYSIREKVVHREGLARMIAPIEANWSNFILINDHQIVDDIEQCGDKRNEYEIITEWGILLKIPNKKTDRYLDPFYFAKGVIGKLIPFANGYLRLVGFDQCSKIAEREEVFKKAIEYFRENGLITLN
jgi:hypothetical protein